MVRGSRNGYAKLSEEQVRAIKARLAEGANQTKLAAEYGVKTGAINHIHTGRNWGHLFP